MYPVTHFRRFFEHAESAASAATTNAASPGAAFGILMFAAVSAPEHDFSK